MIRRILNRLRILKNGQKLSGRSAGVHPHASLIEKYHYFQELLRSNNEILKIAGDLEDRLPGERTFGVDFIKSSADAINFTALRMIKSLNHMSGNGYPQLYGTLDLVNTRISTEFETGRLSPLQDFTVPYGTITGYMTDAVGGKNAALGELRNNAGMPVPDGFAITTHAYDVFMKNNRLSERIHHTMTMIDLADQDTIEAAGREIQSMILQSEIPAGPAAAVHGAYGELARSAGENVRVAVRSSNVNEDGALSFAGQYMTLLNVDEKQLLPAYRQIIASFYSPPAIAYRLYKGLIDDEQHMAVGCMIMIDAGTAGIVYTRDPINPEADTVIISAVPGLGKPSVDGTAAPDVYRVDRSTLKVKEKQIAEKPGMLVTDPSGGIARVAVAADEQNKPCLSDMQAGLIAEKALQVENHHAVPQDIEWCMDRSGRLFILQARRLRFAAARERRRNLYEGYTLLIDRGSIICPGAGIGRAFILNDEAGVPKVPSGAVLVARHSSPALVRVMERVSAIVTDTGSVAGHMASMAREFNIPCITNTESATAIIRDNEEITVDAYSARVYRGVVLQLAGKAQPRPAPMKDTPVYNLLQKVSRHITPLHLTDPASATFAADRCETIHDITRYCHEKALSCMFSLCDDIPGGTAAMKADIRLPVDLYVLDLGGGIRGVLYKGKVSMVNISSVPFLAFMKGMTHKAIRWWEPRRFDLKGFFSVLSSGTARIAEYEKPIGKRTYAAVSNNYFNFNSRVGYHFSTIDAYCDEIRNNNYITFYFQGGASGDIRRTRRAKFLTAVLNALGFVTETKGDRVMARLRKYDRDIITEKLELLGRLTLCALHLDMLMTTDASVDWFVKAFLEGNYNFEFKK